MSEKNTKYLTSEAVVCSQEQLAEGIYSLWIQCDCAKTAVPGQFVAVYPKDQAHLLPRPISICEINEERTALRLVYRVVGFGTDEFSRLTAGEHCKILGPLGNGYTMKGQTAILAAGGIGIPPMVQLAKEFNQQGVEVKIVVGYRSELFLYEELKRYGTVYVSTEDGSFGTKGNILDAIREQNIEAEIVYACGPMPMLRALKQYGEEKNIEVQISLEERMACGIGACLGCVCKTKEPNHHTHVHNARICTDGPVFDAREVEI